MARGGARGSASDKFKAAFDKVIQMQATRTAEFLHRRKADAGTFRWIVRPYRITYMQGQLQCTICT
jgi:hypothetical protein